MSRTTYAVALAAASVALLSACGSAAAIDAPASPTATSPVVGSNVPIPPTPTPTESSHHLPIVDALAYAKVQTRMPGVPADLVRGYVDQLCDGRVSHHLSSRAEIEVTDGGSVTGEAIVRNAILAACPQMRDWADPTPAPRPSVASVVVTRATRCADAPKAGRPFTTAQAPNIRDTDHDGKVCESS